MSNWIPIAVADLEDARAAKLVEALRTKALAAGQSDPVPRTIATAVHELRAAIGFSGRYTLDAEETHIPASLRDLVVQRIVRVAKQRLLMPFSEAEAEEEKTYQRRLEQLNAGKWPVETPDNAAPAAAVQSASASPRIKTKPRDFSRRNQDGA